MATPVSDFLLERLAEWDVKIIYGPSRDGINGMLDSERDEVDKEGLLGTLMKQR